MRSARFILLGIILMTCLVAVGIVAAAERQVTNESVDQWYSALSGDRVLWSDDRAGDYNVYLFNATEEAETAITNDSANQTVSTISMRSLIEGNRLVWQDNRSGNWDIYMYDLASGEEEKITDDAADQINPAIAGGRLVWQDNRSGNWDIFMYDLASGEEVQITTNASQQISPGVTGSLIAWNDDRFGNWDIYIWLPDETPAEETGDTGTETETDTGIETDTKTGTDTETYTGTGTDTDTETDTSTDTDTKTGTDTETYTGTGTDAEPTPNSTTRVANVPDHTTIHGSSPTIKPGITFKPLLADFTYTEDTSMARTLMFQDTSTGNPVAWYWDFNDGTTSTNQNPAHKWGVEGNYTVTLRVTDSKGATDSVAKDVAV